MTDIKRQLDSVVKNTLANHIIPVKTPEGILVGNVLIVSEGTVKHIYRSGKCLYNNISLNVVAVKLANILARYRSSTRADEIYRADQEYAKWFIDAQILLKKYHAATHNKDYDRADVLWARYCESKLKTDNAKNSATSLTLL